MAPQLNFIMVCCLQDTALVLFNFCCYDYMFSFTLCTQMCSFFPHIGQRKKEGKAKQGLHPTEIFTDGHP